MRSATGSSAKLPTAASAPAPTRERILFEASNLFARRGYHGTSTREIARAVGIRQPSLFHHFPSKDSILQELLSSDLNEAVPFAEAVAEEGGPASGRLYRYLRHDVLHLVESPYNLSGLYTEEVMAEPAFTPWARKRARLHAAVERIVRQGVASGEFVDHPTVLVREAITGILVRTLTLFSGGRIEAGVEVGDQIASFVLRAILADPSELARVRESARDEGHGDLVAPAARVHGGRSDGPGSKAASLRGPIDL